MVSTWWDIQSYLIGLSRDLQIFSVHNTQYFLHVGYLKQTRRHINTSALLTYSCWLFLIWNPTRNIRQRCLTSSRSTFLMWSGLLALKCRVTGRDDFGGMMPWSCGTVNSSPNSSTPCSLQDTGRAVLFRRVTERLSCLKGRETKKHTELKKTKEERFLGPLGLNSFPSFLHSSNFHQTWKCSESN